MPSHCSEHSQIGKVYLGVAVVSFLELVTLRDKSSRDKVHNLLDDSFVTATAFTGRHTEMLSRLKEEAPSEVFAVVTTTRAVASRRDDSHKGA